MLIKEQYPYAYYIHCYDHQLNLSMLQDSFSIPEVRLFFINIGGFPAFFNRSPQHIKVSNQFWISVTFLKRQAQGETSTAHLC